MQYRLLGKSSVLLSEIGFGTGDNAGLMVIGSEHEQIDTVGRALELGINYFDTSPYYGKGFAEINLGRALKMLRAEAIICTKVEILAHQLDDIESVLTNSLEGSLRRLGRDEVDILMVHNPPRVVHDLRAPTWPPLTPADMLGPVYRALERARDGGKIRFFGIACDGAEAAALEPLLETGHFTVINLNHNLVNPDVGILSHARQHGVGVAVIRPLAGGALSSRVLHNGVAGRHDVAGGADARVPRHFEQDLKRGRAFAFLETPSRTLAQAAYMFALMHPAVTTVLGGFSDRAQLEELAAVPDMPALHADDIERIQAAYG